MPGHSRVCLFHCELKACNLVRQGKQFILRLTEPYADGECHRGGVQFRLSLPQDIQ